MTVNLFTSSATGAFGTDALNSIENTIGSGGNDILDGDDANNLLAGGDGDDTLVGNGGKDVLVTGRGTDTAAGGAGDDTVVVGLGNKTLRGDAGFDTLDFGTVKGVVTVDFAAGTYDADFVDATPRWSVRDLDGDGIDESDGTEARLFNGVLLTPQQVYAADPAHADSDDDLTRILPDTDDAEFDSFKIELVNVAAVATGIFSGFERVVGGESGATILLSGSVDRFDGRVSNRDVIDLSGQSVAQAYNLRTGATDIALLAGDAISGIEGLIGGRRKDRFTGDDGANMFTGGAGGDVLEGAGGNDELIGGIGRDTLRGGAGSDTLSGNPGQDRLFGNAGSDRLDGGSGDDRLDGGGKRDILDGENGDDLIFGGAGRDVLSGGKSADALKGGKGADDLTGGNGRDLLTGNGGADTFHFAAGHGRDTITDMILGVDTITIRGVAASDIAITTRTHSTKIEYGPGDVIILQGVTEPIDVNDLL